MAHASRHWLRNLLFGYPEFRNTKNNESGYAASSLLGLLPQNISLSQSVKSNLSVNEAALDIFKTLATDLDPEGRYLFLNAIANQLRYPNSHTAYFSDILCCLFSDAQQVIVKEQITRVLLERLITEKPHPWGLLVTFSELVKNPKYNFWNHSFTRCAPEIQNLLENARRKLGCPKPVYEANVVSDVHLTIHAETSFL
uniref:CCR4-Not complex component Not1 C-terminal domain-containing protein n=1 Tax=Opuntia streptacantha TaxID=393608 RepID=A0A7C9AKR4_OPUST